MVQEVSIDPTSGMVHIGNVGALSPWQDRANIVSLLNPFASGSRDHGNGYEWLYFKGLLFDGFPCALGLCFRDGWLEQIGWSVTLPEAPKDANWPTREQSNREVKFVGAVLDKQLGHRWRTERFAWGQVWSCFDEKEFSASNGLRYAKRSFS
jgi:hypothetical protein